MFVYVCALMHVCMHVVSQYKTQNVLYNHCLFIELCMHMKPFLGVATGIGKITIKPLSSQKEFSMHLDWLSQIILQISVVFQEKILISYRKTACVTSMWLCPLKVDV